MRAELGRVNEDWSDRTAYIIGGGDSLRDFDFSCLEGRFTIGPNEAAIRLKTNALITIDRNFYRNRLNEIREYAKSGGKAFVSMAPSHDYPEVIPEVTYVAHTRGNGMSHDPTRIFGLHSGYAAVNLAFLAGCKNICMLGFDMHYKSGQSHWHGGYSWFRQSSDRLVRRWAVAFDPAAEHLDRAGVNVTNYVGPLGSMVTCFPTRPLESLYEELAA